MPGGGNSYLLNEKNAIFFRRWLFRRFDYGGVLIEFAFSIPILISFLFFVCDHYRFFELKDKLKSSVYLAASMIQQISNTRSDKSLPMNDIKRIIYVSCLNMFHTNTMFKPWPFGVFFCIDIHYIKRINNNSYNHQSLWAHTGCDYPSPLGMYSAYYNVGKYNLSQVESISPDMICYKDGEERLCIVASYRKIGDFNKSKLGLFILEPKEIDNYQSIFMYKIVITPKPGLFPITRWN